jgi:hypothetical protein
MTDGDEGIVQSVASTLVVVHVSGCDDRKPLTVRNVCKGACETLVAAYGIALQFDEKAITPEHGATAVRETPSSGNTLALQHPRQQSAATSGQYDQPIVPGFQRGEIEPGVAAIFLVEVGLRDEAA